MRPERQFSPEGVCVRGVCWGAHGGALRGLCVSDEGVGEDGGGSWGCVCVCGCLGMVGEVCIGGYVGFCVESDFVGSVGM